MRDHEQPTKETEMTDEQKWEESVRLHREYNALVAAQLAGAKNGAEVRRLTDECAAKGIVLVPGGENAPKPISYHPAVLAVIKYFKYEHLPSRLQDVSRPFSELAEQIAARSSCPETTVALRKLLESKDAAVRAALG